eukprot:scaffold20022_cov112-Isochrysis_galbana.AAC.1
MSCRAEGTGEPSQNTKKKRKRKQRERTKDRPTVSRIASLRVISSSSFLVSALALRGGSSPRSSGPAPSAGGCGATTPGGGGNGLPTSRAVGPGGVLFCVGWVCSTLASRSLALWMYPSKSDSASSSAAAEGPPPSRGPACSSWDEGRSGASRAASAVRARC